MAGSVSLHELIGALTGAVTEAQDAIQKHQLAIIGNYFDAKGRPLSFHLMLPDPSRRAEAHEGRQLAVPLLSVVEPTILGISEFCVDFDVELGSLGAPAPAAGPEPTTQPEPGASAAPAHAGAPVDVPSIVHKGAPPPDAQAAPAAGPRAAQGLEQRKPAPMNVGLASRSTYDGPLARLSIKVEGRPAAEGLVRLIDALNKTI